jgi:hypothetical protein
MSLERVAEGCPAVDRILIAPPTLLFHQNACLDQIGDDLLHGSFCDPHGLGHVTETGLRVTGQAHEHVRVIAEKRPARLLQGGLAAAWVAQRHMKFYSYFVIPAIIFIVS